MHTQSGLSLVEILFSILLLSLVFIALFGDLLARQKASVRLHEAMQALERLEHDVS